MSSKLQAHQPDLLSLILTYACSYVLNQSHVQYDAVRSFEKDSVKMLFECISATPQMLPVSSLLWKKPLVWEE